jgi:hypothetical protein
LHLSLLEKCAGRRRHDAKFEQVRISKHNLKFVQIAKTVGKFLKGRLSELLTVLGQAAVRGGSLLWGTTL